MQSALATRLLDELHVCVCACVKVSVDRRELPIDLWMYFGGSVTSLNIELKAEYKFQDLTLYTYSYFIYTFYSKIKNN